MNSQISDSELEIMKIIWVHDSKMMLAEIVEELHKKGFEWKNNTILTFLSRLTEKKFLKIKKKGRKNEYIALLTEQDYLGETTKEFVGKVYEGEVKDLIATLVQNDLISSKEIDELKDYWENKKK
ncbi:BlaI/MecI/CopY family transcriptional regulator [Enterococcus sp. LJL51]|uniref:BlaI/MecI/CopY family transcriptional regulator n=1 Tax=Enterococcus sp. LJL51 TaxID=3416656 RepID=UPI003CEFC520